MPDQNFELRTGQHAAQFEGLEFVELATTDAAALGTFLQQLGFRAAARHRSKEVTLYRQGQINLIVNSTPGSIAEEFARRQGSSVCALALRTPDATSAYQNLLARGAWEAATNAGAMELNIPAIEALGGTQIYLIDRYGDQINIYDIDFKTLPEAQENDVLFDSLDALTLQMNASRCAPWRDFYCQLFGFNAVGEKQLVLGNHFSLQLELLSNGPDDLSAERIAALHLTCHDPEQTRARLVAKGLELRAVADRAGHVTAWEVVSPIADLSVRFMIGN